MSWPRHLVVLGSTGSVGCQALDVVRWHPTHFRVLALAARRDSDAFRAQVAEFEPRFASLAEPSSRPWDMRGVGVSFGPEALESVASLPDADIVLVATSGTAGLRPALAALHAGKSVALANKEALIMGGHLMTQASRETGAPILPVDSEHNAIWQCLRGEPGQLGTQRVRRVVLTASGGPFRDLTPEQLCEVTPTQALKHPNWNMGPKISVDSATLMNKGLEVLEACWLFGLELGQVEVVLHRESVVHSLVEFVDGSMKAQMASPDMRIPIQYALSYPDRLPTQTASLDLGKIGKLSFEPIDLRLFPAFPLALEAGRKGGSYPTVLNGSNEEAVNLFLAGGIRFDEISRLIQGALDAHVPYSSPGLDEIFEADEWSRRFVQAETSRWAAGVA